MALTYQWTQIAGTTVTINNATTLDPDFVTSTPGVYGFRLTVTDSDSGFVATDDVYVTALSAPVVVTPEFRPIRHTFTTGEGTAKVELVVEVMGAASADTQYVDELGIFPGTASEWTRGGLDGLSTVDILRSDVPPSDDYATTGVIPLAEDEEVVRYGKGIVPGAGNSSATVVDREVPFSRTVRYRPVAYTEIADGLTFVTEGAPVGFSLLPKAWLLSDPMEPDHDVWVSVTSGSESESRSHASEAIAVAGQSLPVVSTIGPAPRSGRTWTINVWSLSQEEKRAYDAILAEPRTLLLRDMTGDKRWVRPVQDEQWERRFRYDIHEVTLNFVETTRPA